MCQAYNEKVIPRSIRVGDMVLRRAESVGKGNVNGELLTNYKGPYVIHQEFRPKKYKLKYTSGKLIPHTWNADILCKYFI